MRNDADSTARIQKRHVAIPSFCDHQVHITTHSFTLFTARNKKGKEDQESQTPSSTPKAVPAITRMSEGEEEVQELTLKPKVCTVSLL